MPVPLYLHNISHLDKGRRARSLAKIGTKVAFFLFDRKFRLLPGKFVDVRPDELLKHRAQIEPLIQAMGLELRRGDGMVVTYAELNPDGTHDPLEAGIVAHAPPAETEPPKTEPEPELAQPATEPAPDEPEPAPEGSDPFAGAFEEPPAPTPTPAIPPPPPEPEPEPENTPPPPPPPAQPAAAREKRRLRGGRLDEPAPDPDSTGPRASPLRCAGAGVHA